MADVIYKLPLDESTDGDLINWINKLPRSKKAEVIRHALRFYISHLKEGEIFIMPSVNVATPVTQVISESEDKKKKPKLKPKVSALVNITKVEE
jgi:hypothetical protein